jgi:hypothetical protein
MTNRNKQSRYSQLQHTRSDMTLAETDEFCPVCGYEWAIHGHSRLSCPCTRCGHAPCQCEETISDHSVSKSRRLAMGSANTLALAEIRARTTNSLPFAEASMARQLVRAEFDRAILLGWLDRAMKPLQFAYCGNCLSAHTPKCCPSRCDIKALLCEMGEA